MTVSGWSRAREVGPVTGMLSVCAPHARDFTHRRTGSRATNRWKSRIRVRVEHSIGVIKRVFGFTKVRYRGLEKNAQRLFVTCALANLFILATTSCAAQARSASAAGPLTQNGA